MTRAPSRTRAWIGTSGYQYDHWRGRFYPPDLPRPRWLAWYARHFETVEINNTFYGLPAPERFDAWREQTPTGFRFALKLSRYVTHMRRLRDPEPALARFLERADRLGLRLGPILVQLPPRWHADPERLDAFLRVAPKRYRWAVEVRDPTWLCEAVYAVLRRHRAALCLHDGIPDHPRVLTARWTYLRFHGPEGGYAGSYSPQRLVAEARRIRTWLAEGRTVYAYFNNDVGGHAVANAAALARYVRGPVAQRRESPLRRP